MTIVHAPPNEAPITELFAFLVLGENGEDIWGIPFGKRRPFEELKQLTADLALSYGKPVRLVRFVRAETIWSSD